MNYEYKPAYSVILRRLFAFLISVIYVVLMALVIVLIFVLKTYLFQTGQPQDVVSIVPSILISIAVQVFNAIYTILLKVITDFEEHKTIISYESSLVSKAFLINFLVTFYSLFIYAFFSSFLDA